MRKNSQLRCFLYGTIVLCSIGAVSYREVSQVGNSQSQQVPTTLLSQETTAPSVALMNQAENLPTQQTTQTLVGFSNDSHHFIYLESWRDTGAGVPHAALQVVNIATNTCIKAGCLQTNYGEEAADLSIQAAENKLLEDTHTLRQTLNLTNPIAGTRLLIVSKSQTQDGSETVTVQLRDGKVLQLTLKQTSVISTLGGGTADKDRTAMSLTASHQGKVTLISNPEQWHDWTLGFSIRDVHQSPDGKAIVVLLTSEKRAFEGTLGRTVVQSLQL